MLAFITFLPSQSTRMVVPSVGAIGGSKIRETVDLSSVGDVNA
jgi:hypothetical protein